MTKAMIQLPVPYWLLNYNMDNSMPIGGQWCSVRKIIFLVPLNNSKAIPKFTLNLLFDFGLQPTYPLDDANL